MKKTLAPVVLCLCVFLAGVISSPAMAEEKVSYEEAFGAAIGMALYDTQVVLGITADSVAKGMYSSDLANGIIKEQIGMMAVLRDSYVKPLIQSSITTEADRATLKVISVCIDKLNETAGALKAYIQSPNDSNADNFQTKRKTSYNAIAELLGLEKKK